MLRDEDYDAFSEILESVGMKIPFNTQKEIVDAWSTHLEMKAEIESYQHVSRSERECEKCKSLKKEIESLESDIDVYQKNVIKRHPGAVRAYVENGNVLYDLV